MAIPWAARRNPRDFLDAPPVALLLDMDGVLAEVSRSYRTAIVATASEYGVTVTAEDISACKAKGNANNDWELTRRLVQEGGVADVELQDVIDRFERIYQGTVIIACYVFVEVIP